jgi:hypothetical protein
MLNSHFGSRQAHNLKVIGSNPIPQPDIKPLKIHRFRGFFAAPNLAGNFARGSVVEALGGKSQRRIGAGRRGVMTRL